LHEVQYISTVHHHIRVNSDKTGLLSFSFL